MSIVAMYQMQAELLKGCVHRKSLEQSDAATTAAEPDRNSVRVEVIRNAGEVDIWDIQGAGDSGKQEHTGNSRDRSRSEAHRWIFRIDRDKGNGDCRLLSGAGGFGPEALKEGGELGYRQANIGKIERMYNEPTSVSVTGASAKEASENDSKVCRDGTVAQAREISVSNNAVGRL